MPLLIPTTTVVRNRAVESTDQTFNQSGVGPRYFSLFLSFSIAVVCVWINGIDPERLAVVRRKIFLTRANTNRKVKTSLFRRHNILLSLVLLTARRHLT
jgi:hypothetical protein